MSIIETMIDIPMEHERNVCGQFDAYLKKIERTLHGSLPEQLHTPRRAENHRSGADDPAGEECVQQSVRAFQARQYRYRAEC